MVDDLKRLAGHCESVDESGVDRRENLRFGLRSPRLNKRRTYYQISEMYDFFVHSANLSTNLTFISRF